MTAVFNAVFLFMEGCLLLLCLISICYTGFLRLESRIGVARDGYPPGKAVPSWSLPDSTGLMRKTPGADHWQLLIFTNHALVAFPDLLAGIRQLASTAKELEIIILAQR